MIQWVDKKAPAKCCCELVSQNYPQFDGIKCHKPIKTLKRNRTLQSLIVIVIVLESLFPQAISLN